MPRRRMMDMRMMDGRNPYGSRGGYVSSRRMRRMRDRGMDYGEHYGVRGGEHYAMDGNYAHSQYADERGSRDYESMGQSDMGYDYADMRGRQRNARGQYTSDRGYDREMDGHYGAEGKTYYPIEAMGTFNGYWGMPEEDYGRGRRRDYGDYNYGSRYDMRGRDYGYGYDYGDYGESLTKEELEHWCKKMMSELDEREKQMFSKEAILQRAKNIGIQFDKFSEMEFYVNVVKNYTDHKKSIGENPDMAIKLARDDFNDEDGEYKGSEWLAVYFDTFVEDED